MCSVCSSPVPRIYNTNRVQSLVKGLHSKRINGAGINRLLRKLIVNPNQKGGQFVVKSKHREKQRCNWLWPRIRLNLNLNRVIQCAVRSPTILLAIIIIQSDHWSDQSTISVFSVAKHERLCWTSFSVALSVQLISFSPALNEIRRESYTNLWRVFIPRYRKIKREREWERLKRDKVKRQIVHRQPDPSCDPSEGYTNY